MSTNRLHFVQSAPLSAAERKASLRAQMKKRRGENENRDAKEALLLDNFLRAGLAEKERYFVYLSFSSEAPTDTPVTDGKEMRAVALGEDFTLSPFGVREPVGEPFEGTPDVVVLPLLAVDGRGVRLGYGGGYYDRFLERHPEALAVAYCFDFQIVREVPEEEHDRRAALIISDKRIIRCRG